MNTDGTDTTTESAAGTSDAVSNASSTGANSSGGGADSSAAVSASSSGATSGWDVDSWDGQADSVHDSYRPFYDRVNGDWESKYKTATDDAALYRDIVTGLGDDPRIAEASGKLDELQKKYDAVVAQQAAGKLSDTAANDKTAKLEAAYNALLDRQTEQAVTTFKEKHKAILSEPAKRQELINLMDEGWDEEAAAMLVGKTSQTRDRAIAIITEHQLRGSGHRLAVSQAITEQNPTNISAPGALLTAGANGTVNPVRTSDRNIRNLSRGDSRMEAARLALIHTKSR